MDKRLTKIAKIVNDQTEDFFVYLDELLKDDIKEALNLIQEETKVYLFSGLIRNYFLAHVEYRDIDIVLESEIDICKTFPERKIIRNSFGGYKIMFDSGPMDLWFIKDTWAFKKESQTAFPFQLEKKIPSTVFFNFSSVIFCINIKQFYFTEHFLKFLMDREIDFVESENANYGLCVVNSFYYSQKYRLKISKRLSTLIKKLDRNIEFDYESIQMKHFGKIIFSRSLIKQKINNLR